MRDEKHRQSEADLQITQQVDAPAPSAAAGKVFA
jgi:hypothetical protein